MIKTVDPVSVTDTDSTRRVIVVCPDCGKTHVHGWPYGEPEIGHRVADCGAEGYYIRTPNE